ncbi:MAG: RNA polymerase sigma-70 factor (ECF subfamily) [Candidatus Paceibacteria bacterium]|jgi:RNA polymerase sigma-70 factor (ECF subfamily)
MSQRKETQKLPESWLKKPGAGEKAPTDMGTEATQLMMATKGGDAAAFDSLVAKLRSRAFYIAHSLVGSREDALDLAQESFMKVFRARETFRDGEPFLPWFHRILRNTCYSHLRKRGRLRKVSLSSQRPGAEDEGDWQLADPKSPAPSAAIEAKEQTDTFQAALAQLSARDREILSLRHHRELSYREISESLGIPQGTVMSRLFHARRRLRESLEFSFDSNPEAAGTEIQSLGGDPS